MAGFSTFVVLLLGAISVVTAQRTCYSCTGYYVIDSTEDLGNCFTVTSETSTQANCDGQCSTSISLANPSEGSIRIIRGCQRTNDLGDCNECTNPEDCLMCCSSADNCNNGALLGLLENKALTQTCYSCRFSEIPGVKSDSGCALDFNEGGNGVDTVHCPGMCYSASSYIPGVEDIVRGCAYFGNDCDADYYENGNEETERNRVRFKRSCCMGDKCNSAMAVKAGTVMVMLAIIVGMFASYRV